MCVLLEVEADASCGIFISLKEHCVCVFYIAYDIKILFTK